MAATREKIIHANHSLQASGHPVSFNQVIKKAAHESGRALAPAISLQGGDNIHSFAVSTPRQVATSPTIAIATHDDTTPARAQKGSTAVIAARRTEQQLRQLLLQQMQAHRKTNAKAAETRTLTANRLQNQKDREQHEQQLRKRLQASLRTRAVGISAQRTTKVPDKLVGEANLLRQESIVTRKRSRGEFLVLISGQLRRFWTLRTQHDAPLDTHTHSNFIVGFYYEFVLCRFVDVSDSGSRFAYS